MGITIAMMKTIIQDVNMMGEIAVVTVLMNSIALNVNVWIQRNNNFDKLHHYNGWKKNWSYCFFFCKLSHKNAIKMHEGDRKKKKKGRGGKKKKKKKKKS